mmetsp:Transcript_32805/g.37536  ORF Transcript_32805/g.37536 Transcript_32805/m.37536 type:complete len:509 (-) Transcript_32805:26-1552(-)
MKKLKEKNLPKAMEIISKANDPTVLAFKTKLALPEAQISDKEIDMISKMNSDKNLALTSGANEATKALLGELSQREQTPMTMRTPLVQNNLMSEARNMISIMNAQTPLIGGQGPEVHEGMLTRAQKNTIAQTPNTLLAMSMKRPDSILRPKDTVARMPPQGVDTPMRAGFAAPVDGHKELADSAWESDSISMSMSAEQQKYMELMQRKRDKLALMQNFQSMPKPKNAYKIDLEDIEEMDEAELAIFEEQKIEDREFTKKRLQEEDIQREIEQFKRQSQVIRFDLPRPSVINTEKFVSSRELSAAESLIEQEIEKMLVHDNSKFPKKSIKPVNRVLGEYPEYSLKELQTAEDLISQELEAQEDFEQRDEIIARYQEYIDDLGNMKFLPSKKCFIELKSSSESERQEALEAEQKCLLAQLNQEKERISDIEKELRESFEKRMQEERQNREKIDFFVKDLIKKSRQLEVFQVIQNLEKKIIHTRVEEQRKFLRQQEVKEKELQQKYYSLTH